MPASSVSVLEGRLRAFVKAELESAVLTAMQALAPGSCLEAEESGMGWFVAALSLTEETRVLPRLQVVERDHRKLCDAVEEDTRWLRDAVEAFAVMLHPQVLICQAISESLGLDLATLGESFRSVRGCLVLAGAELRTECRLAAKAALFAQLDTNGDGDVSLQEFHAAKVTDGQWKACAVPGSVDALLVGCSPGCAEVFEKLDADMDGRVSREEFSSATVAAARSPRQSSDGVEAESKRASQDAGQEADDLTAELNITGLDDNPLFAAVLSEDPARALALLRSAAAQQLHAQDQEGCTALHRASALPGLVKVRGVLLEKGGAQLASARDLHMRTALHHSALAGCVEACQQLLDAPCFHDADRPAWSQFIQVMQCRSTKLLCAQCGLVLNSE
ncbi:unnamed protein product [Symbiodinium necroappetens]|uniref:EF-hand domain-containing protein n=1 Tax=Symbiodinium necroappetens TaxID=1628268 RepID=A0A813C326_9DINO|nr:unnamed protein product [Symbiodinium necroappetens]